MKAYFNWLEVPPNWPLFLTLCDLSLRLSCSVFSSVGDFNGSVAFDVQINSDSFARWQQRHRRRRGFGVDVGCTLRSSLVNLFQSLKIHLFHFKRFDLSELILFCFSLYLAPFTMDFTIVFFKMSHVSICNLIVSTCSKLFKQF